MRYLMTVVLFIIALPTSSAVADDGTAKLPRERQGVWMATEAEYCGKAPPAEFVSKLKS